jgi:hypothetical protein
MIKCTFDGSFEFNKIHGYYGLHSIKPEYFYEDKGQTLDNTKYWLFIDMPEEIGVRKNEVILAKKQGIKIVSLFYDESRFPFVDTLINENLIDMIILFDKKYQDRFPISTYISDYYLLDTHFPDYKEERNNRQCYFGHKLYGRNIPETCEYVRGNTLKDVYEIISTYSKGYITTEGKGEENDITYQNKAKFLEMIFCGLQVECQNGIETINYDKFKNKKITGNDLIELHKINNMVKLKLIEKIINL